MFRHKLTIFLVAAALFLGGWQNLANHQEKIPLVNEGSADRLKVIFFDIGQGDAALIQTPDGKNILVDGGPDDHILAKLGQYLPFSMRRLDMVILTHPHSDHLNGLIAVLKRYQVGEIYYTGVIHTTGEFFEWLKLIKEKNIPLKIVKEPQDITLSSSPREIVLQLIYPDSDLTQLNVKYTNHKEGKNLNNTSIVFRLVYGNTKFLFTGDIEQEIEEYLIKKGVALSAQVLKVGHHGSKSSTTELFLNAVSPEDAVISVGANNDYGHPHLRVLKRLERHGIKIFRTDLDGDVKFVSNGREVYH